MQVRVQINYFLTYIILSTTILIELINRMVYRMGISSWWIATYIFRNINDTFLPPHKQY